ncbi:hypothetical protein FAUST_8349 [Fusarium austroamericanum]|uniref:DUF7908 domain-containing protein n=1 Tax=Fusarium austroamericanum TaxID=282268 RepID=A0AAN5Z5Q9_FUSAU|nr:hypothetical protein FAUST_8349 [Fusarium austroamericanum]
MKCHPFLALAGIAQVAASLKLIDESEDNGVICYTYLSTYLAAVDAGPAPALPTTRGILPPYFTNRSTSAVPSSTFPADRESSIILQDPDSTVALPTSSDFAILTEFTDLVSPTAAISSEASATSSQAEVTGQAVIFFVAPDTDNQRRSLVKRDIPGGFVNGVNPVDICADADIFQLADGQLLDNGSPVYYSGEPYKQFASDGAPPDGAITREFAAVNGNLVFTSSSLPNTGFCQDDNGQVYITFGSSPPGCDPVLLQVYTGKLNIEQCRNGEIPGPDQASSISSELSPVTESTDIVNLPMSSGSQEPASTVLVEPTDVLASTDTSPILTETQSTAIAEEEEETATTDSSSTDLSSQTSSRSLASSTISTIKSQSIPLFPTLSSTDSIGTTVSEDITSSSELSLEPSSSIVLSTDSTATEPATEETTTSISTTTLPEETESSTQLGSTTTAEETTATETTTTAEDTTATETTTTAEDTTATETTTAAGDTTATETTTTVEETTVTEPTTTAETTSATEETTTTTEETTTTGCNSEVTLTTVALLNPTPVFDYENGPLNEAVEIILPFNVANTGATSVYVTTNGVISVGSDTGGDVLSPLNEQLPTDQLSLIAICPYWDGFLPDYTRGDTIVYEVFEGQHGTQATFEWIVGKDNDDVFHFSATLYKNHPGTFKFAYYTTPEKGSSATVGMQDRFNDEAYGYSFDEAIIFDGSIVIFNLYSHATELLPLDATECGKGDPPDGSNLFTGGD